MRSSILLFIYITTTFCQVQAQSQNQVGGPCEGCEALLEYGSGILTNTDTLPKYLITEPKLKISGTVFQKDGQTPAKNVILYIYHTNRKGIYEKKGDESGWARRHGHIRGWVKTGEDGKYTFYTFRPASYPNRRAPEHIHITVKEPDKKAYYIDDFMFTDDPLLTNQVKQARKNRGGSGIVSLESTGSYFLIKRDIVLGLNIPNYP